MKWIAKFILKLTKWRADIQVIEWPKKAILIIAPHTSNWDFFHTFWLKWLVPVSTNYVAKKALFQFPLGYFFRAVGGAPIERTGNQNQVEAIAEIFKNREEFRLALAPEGTRKLSSWKSGFYHIAKKAGVPIIMIKVDYQKKLMKVSKPFLPTDNQEQDFQHIRDYYQGVVARYPEKYQTI